MDQQKSDRMKRPTQEAVSQKTEGKHHPAPAGDLTKMTVQIGPNSLRRLLENTVKIRGAIVESLRHEPTGVFVGLQGATTIHNAQLGKADQRSSKNRPMLGHYAADKQRQQQGDRHHRKLITDQRYICIPECIPIARCQQAEHRHANKTD